MPLNACLSVCPLKTRHQIAAVQSKFNRVNLFKNEIISVDVRNAKTDVFIAVF